MAQLALFIARVLDLYSFIIMMRILMSWINPYPQPGTFTWYVSRLTDPFLNAFRSRHLMIGMLDFSPMIAIGLLAVVKSVFEIYGTIGRMSLSLILQLFLSAFWSYGVQLFFTLLFIMLVVKTIASFMSGSNFSYAVSRMTSVLDPLEDKIRNTFFRRSIPKQTTLNLITLLIVGVSYFVVKYIFNLLLFLVIRIPF